MKDPDIDKISSSNTVLMLKKIFTLPLDEQNKLFETFNFKDEALFGQFISAQNPEMLDYVLKNQGKEHWHQFINNGFYINIALNTQNWEQQLGVLLKNDYSFGALNQEVKNVQLANFARSLAGFVQEEPEKTEKLLSVLHSFLYKRQNNPIKTNLSILLAQTLHQTQNEDLFKYYVLAANDINGIENYQPKHLLKLVEQDPIVWLTLLNKNSFLALSKTHPLKESFYSIIKTISSSMTLDDIRSKFGSIVELALASYKEDPVYLKTLVDLKIRPNLDLLPKCIPLEKNIATTVFQHYIMPFWGEFSDKEHIGLMYKIPDVSRYFPKKEYVGKFLEQNKVVSITEKEFMAVLMSRKKEAVESLFLQVRNAQEAGQRVSKAKPL